MGFLSGEEKKLFNRRTKKRGKGFQKKWHGFLTGEQKMRHGLSEKEAWDFL